MIEPSWNVPGYRHVRELGSGASGTVVLATDRSGASVAIKYLAADLLADPGFRAEFRDEATLLSGVHDPHVVRLLAFQESAAGAALVMDLVDGASLRALLREHGPTEPEAALVALRGSLLGLGAAHAQGVVHRDYKPENVLVTQAGRSILTDFGVAARAGTAGMTSGTPEYMAPEQWQGRPASFAGDVYAAAVTFAECLIGRPPFDADDLDALRRQHERAPVPVAWLPEPVRPLLERGMAKDPAQRPSGTAEFLAELEAAATAGYGPDWEERGRDQLARRAALLAFLFPLAGGVVGGTAIASTVLGRARPSGRVLAAAGAVAVLVLGGGAVLFAGVQEPPVVVAAPGGSLTAGAPARSPESGAVPSVVGSGSGPEVPAAAAALRQPAAPVAGGGTSARLLTGPAEVVDEEPAAGEPGGQFADTAADDSDTDDTAADDTAADDADDADAGDGSAGGAAAGGSDDGAGLGQGSGSTDGNQGNDSGSGSGAPAAGVGDGTGIGGGTGTDGPGGTGGATGADDGVGLGQGDGSIDGNQGNGGGSGSGAPAAGTGDGTGIGGSGGTDGPGGTGGATGADDGVGLGQGDGSIDGNQGNGGGSGSGAPAAGTGDGTGISGSGGTDGPGGAGGATGIDDGAGLGQGDGSTDGNQGIGGASPEPDGGGGEGSDGSDDPPLIDLGVLTVQL
ncbi:protein kinase domain-containing protein [Pseudonocardia sp. GCM10023141]|uniref:protein kinase domain-containing protein n=1 Tax=Pseudonocardia sp. GCM10023141 TaxID=3252653 RepID=UPI00360B1C8A